MSKRFYKTVSVAAGAYGDWLVLLDGMQLRTPGKIRLSLTSKALAKRVAEEWDAQQDKINPSKMPITRLVNVAVEQSPGRRDQLISEVRRYAETDLICYRCPEPRVLKDRQSAAWDEWQDWAAGQGVALKSTESLQAIAQPTDSLEHIETYAASLSDLQLTLFVHLVAVFGSVILAMAVMKKALTAERAFDLSRIEADYQIELWGEDEEQAEINKTLKAETTILGGLVDLL